MKIADRTPLDIDTELDTLIGEVDKIARSVEYRRKRGYDATDLEADLAKKERRIATIDREYDRRPWSRFFVTSGANGHVHSERTCSTCNKDGKYTEFYWITDLSGKTEEAVVAELGSRLCSVCFPSAPVEWTNGSKKAAGVCAGSGTRNYDESKSRLGYYTGNYGHCNECGKSVTVSTSTLLMRKHDA